MVVIVSLPILLHQNWGQPKNSARSLTNPRACVVPHRQVPRARAEQPLPGYSQYVLWNSCAPVAPSSLGHAAERSRAYRSRRFPHDSHCSHPPLRNPLKAHHNRRARSSGGLTEPCIFPAFAGLALQYIGTVRSGAAVSSLSRQQALPLSHSAPWFVQKGLSSCNGGSL
jgi:hypothetical protein